MQFQNLTKQTFGNLTAISFERRRDASGKSKVYWHCECRCGRGVAVSSSSLMKGESKSCGCWRREVSTRRCTTHGLSHLPEYGIWGLMKARCTNTRGKFYFRYGGRGITVCERWLHSFENFLADMGPRPSPKHSIERTNNAFGYTPENCVWATSIQQANNTRWNHLLTFNGETLTIAQWARSTQALAIGLCYYTLRSRINFLGWSDERALTTPVKKN
jgi:hypothetical protein